MCVYDRYVLRRTRRTGNRLPYSSYTGGTVQRRGRRGAQARSSDRLSTHYSREYFVELLCMRQ